MDTRKVIKSGQVYKVYCQKTGEQTLLINCHDCEQFKGYDKKTATIKCEKVK
jgi:hypothetical protein